MDGPNRAEIPDDLERPEEMARLPGPEVMRRIRDGACPHPPVAAVPNCRVAGVEAGRVGTTREWNAKTTRAIPKGREIPAGNLVSQAGRRTGLAVGTIRGAADGKLCATGSTTCLIIGAS